MGNGYSVQEVDPPVARNTVSFDLNGKAVLVQDASPLMSLNDWLRTQPGLAGTKRMCGEGGCGCCVVAAAPATSQLHNLEESWEYILSEQNSTMAINSVSSSPSGGHGMAPPGPAI